MGERAINIHDLVIEILLHWRGIILWMFVGGILSCAFGYVNFRQSAEAAWKEQLKYSDILELQSEMTQIDLAEVEQVLLNEESLKRWNLYIETSAFMHLDPSRVYQEDLIYTILSDGLRTDLLGVYLNVLSTNKMYQFIADRTEGFSSSDIQELITVTSIGSASNLNITFLAESKEICAAISQAVKSYLAECKKLLAETYGAHTIVLLQDYITDVDSMSLLQKQIDTRTKVISLQIKTANLKNNLSEKQRRYYQLRMLDTFAESNHLVEEAASTNVISMSSHSSTVIKNVVWGMFFALLIYGLAIFSFYVLSGRLRYTDNCAEIFHVPILGHIPAVRTPGTLFGRIDQKLYWLRDKRRYPASGEEAVRLAIAAIAMTAQRKGIRNVCGVCGSMSSEITEKLRNGLKKNSIALQSAENILYCADSLNLLSNVQAAVLVEKAGIASHGEIHQEIEFLRSQEIDILGMVIVE